MTALVLALVFGIVATLLVVAVVWRLVRVQQPGQASSRQVLIALAARAASDESGQGLVDLLAALDRAEPGGPVSLEWVVHRPAKGRNGMLVKIAWDGNEWRRVYRFDELEPMLAARLGPSDAAGLGGRLLADVRAAHAG